ncbi:polyprenyl synthetase family protein, partial [Nocardia brasiliensis]|uniref:polyprenyl synthetase family protein n=1 Tax=Nocardia brasiliensis TaxID=37326 RepID=UPI0004A70DE8
LLGDVLHSTAIGVLADGLPAKFVAAAIERMTTTIVELCRGQAGDCRFETCYRVGLDEYSAMVAGKTGSLMGCASALGAVCAGAEEATVAMMDQFGRELGLALQYIDDILGIWGDPARTGKPVGNDIARRKLTLPVVVAMASETDAGVELAALYRSRVPLSTGDIARATALIEAARGRQITQALADQRINAALSALPDAMDADQLVALAHTLIHRDR